MLAHKFDAVIPTDHRLTVRIPDEIPAGPAELMILVFPAASTRTEVVPAPEEALARWDAVSAELAADPRPFHELAEEEREARLRRVMGSGRGLFSTSEELARRKREEIELEERRFGR